MTVSKKRSGSTSQFPVRLHDMMAFVEAQGKETVIGWVLGGRGFMIHDPKKIVGILSLFFGQTKYKSFLRQLNMWDFERISHGPNKGTYMHPYFVKGNREICGRMVRQMKRFNVTPKQPKIVAGEPEKDLGAFKCEMSTCSLESSKKETVRQSLDSLNKLSSSRNKSTSKSNMGKVGDDKTDTVFLHPCRNSTLSLCSVLPISQYSSLLDLETPTMVPSSNKIVEDIMAEFLLEDASAPMEKYHCVYPPAEIHSLSFPNAVDNRDEHPLLPSCHDDLSSFAGKRFFLV